ncbi:MAG TPA: hypothetical protein VGH38_00585 [Bryobacteraceae bacterium]
MKVLRLCLLAFLFTGLIIAQQPNLGGCQVFPANNIWNTAIDTMPVHPSSSQYVTSIGSGAGIRYDTTMPVNIVPASQPLVPINITYPTESDPGPYPYPANAQVEGGDLHVIVVDQTCWLYETYNSILQSNGSWNADSAAHWNLTSNALRPAGWTSADGAGLPIMPGLMRYSEVLAGQINHALRMTAPATQANNYQWPARHYASHDTSTSLPMMGQRFRLKAGYDISGFSANMQVILRALKKYGAMIADNGLAWSLQGDTDPRWDPNDLLTLRQVLGSNMEAVDVSGLMISPDSGAALQPGGGAAISSVTVSSGSVIGGSNVNVTVTLTDGAPASGAAITLSGSGGAFPTTTVLVGAGLSTQTFSVPTAAVSTNTTLTFAASYNGATVLAPAATVTAPLSSSCPVFPANNIWNVAVDALPLSPNSANYVNSIGSAGGIRYDTTMPFNLVTGSQPLVPINITYPSESDPGPYPFPPNAQVEAGSDAHVMVIDKDRCVLYETYNSVLQPNGSWNVDSAAHWDLNSNALRPAGWTSADAAGLPIYAGLMRYSEVASGQINHALRFTVPHTQARYIWPARHLASSNTDPSLPPMGQRFRLKAGFDISGFSANMQVILRALKRYGMMVADNGLPWSLQGDTDPRWDPNELLTLRQVLGSNMEAVDVSSLMVDPNSGQAGQAGQATVNPAASQVTSLTLASGTVNGGSGVAATVTLSSAAPSTGMNVTLSSSNPGVVASTAVTVAAGATSGQLTISTNTVTAVTAVTLTASAGGGTGSAVLTVNPLTQSQSLPSLLGISVSPTAVVSGTNVNVTVSLASAAPASGSQVSLVSANPAFPNASVTVAAGTTQQTFSLPTIAVSTQSVATIIASYGTVQKSADLTLQPSSTATAGNPASQPKLYGITVSPTSVVGGANVNVTVVLQSGAPAAGALVALTSSNPAFPAAQVTVGSGLSQQTFSLPTAVVSTQSVATIIASLGSSQKSADLTVKPAVAPKIMSLTAPAAVTGGSTVTVSAALSDVAPDGGLTVILASSNSSIVAATTLTVPANTAKCQWTLPTSAVTGSTPVTLTASANGGSGTAVLTVNPSAAPPALFGIIVSPTAVAGGSNVNVTVILTAAAPASGAVVTLSALNPAFPGANVTVAGGATQQTFSLPTSVVSATTVATVVASYGTSQKSADLTMTPGS